MVVDVREWSEAAKISGGHARRWEVVAAAFSWWHKVEDVIKMAKSMGERRVGCSDSFLRFLKDRKTEENENENVNESGESRRERMEVVVVVVVVVVVGVVGMTLLSLMLRKSFLRIQQ